MFYIVDRDFLLILSVGRFTKCGTVVNHSLYCCLPEGLVAFLTVISVHLNIAYCFQ